VTDHPPAPPDPRDLAARAEQLAAEALAVRVALRGSDDRAVRHAGWRLDEIAGHLREAARELVATARDLDFIRDVRSRPHCGADWGCCPDHGATLSGTGDSCRCMARGCGRTWDASRMSLPCEEPPAFRFEDATGNHGLVCRGHAVAARQQVAGARLLPLENEAAR
jgi:hypothetical protein